MDELLDYFVELNILLDRTKEDINTIDVHWSSSYLIQLLADLGGQGCATSCPPSQFIICMREFYFILFFCVLVCLKFFFLNPPYIQYSPRSTLPPICFIVDLPLINNLYPNFIVDLLLINNLYGKFCVTNFLSRKPVQFSSVTQRQLIYSLINKSHYSLLFFFCSALTPSLGMCMVHDI